MRFEAFSFGLIRIDGSSLSYLVSVSPSVAARLWMRGGDISLKSLDTPDLWGLLFCAAALNLNQLSMEGSNPCATIPWLAFQTG